MCSRKLLADFSYWILEIRYLKMLGDRQSKKEYDRIVKHTLLQVYPCTQNHFTHGDAVNKYKQMHRRSESRNLKTNDATVEGDCAVVPCGSFRRRGHGLCSSEADGITKLKGVT